MTVKADKSVKIVQSTGAVETPTGPVVTEQTDDNTSTDAVDYVAPGTTTVDHFDAPVEVVVATPVEPVVVAVGWLADVDTKVVVAPDAAAAAPAPAPSDVVTKSSDTTPADMPADAAVSADAVPADVVDDAAQAAPPVGDASA